jgi:hypothetical protein
VIERNKFGWHVALIEEIRGVYRVFLGKPEGKSETTWKNQGVDGRKIVR